MSIKYKGKRENKFIKLNENTTNCGDMKRKAFKQNIQKVVSKLHFMDGYNVSTWLLDKLVVWAPQKLTINGYI